MSYYSKLLVGLSNQLKNKLFSPLNPNSITYFLKRTCYACPPPREPIVTVLDASCKIGRTLALLLKQSPLIGELRLYDKSSSVCNLAEDLSHIDTKAKVKSYGGQPVLKHALMEADVVVSVGGCKESYKETSKQLFDKNLDDMRTAALHMIEFNPKAIFCIAKPPIESLVPLVSEEFKKAGVYDSRKIIGVTSIASMRANYHVAEQTGQHASDVLCPIVGGISPECVVAVLSRAKPRGIISSREIQRNIGNGEDDVLKLYAEGGNTVCLSPALAISRFINCVLRALQGETNCIDCAFVRQTGHIGQFLPYMTSIVRLGRHGVMSSHMPKINGDEAYLLKKATIKIKEYIRLGESLVTGEVKPEANVTQDEAVQKRV